MFSRQLAVLLSELFPQRLVLSLPVGLVLLHGPLHFFHFCLVLSFGLRHCFVQSVAGQAHLLRLFLVVDPLRLQLVAALSQLFYLNLIVLVVQNLSLRVLE